ncbi:MAG: fibronectin type III domain-containing protein [Treponema sp.]|nr:fibronectin type III domain-containing protein [Treponema sp.]
MRKFFAFFSLALVMLFTSCSGLSEKTGSISFTFSGDQLEKIISKASASRAILKDEISEEQEQDISGTDSKTSDEESTESDLDQYISDPKIVISVELSGDYNKTKSIILSEKNKSSEESSDADYVDSPQGDIFNANSYTLAFDGLPVGAKIKATAIIRSEYTVTIDGKKEVSSMTIMKGSSGVFTVNAGFNSQDIEMKMVTDQQIPLTLTFSTDKVSADDVTTITVYAVRTTSENAKKLLTLAKSSLTAAELTSAIMPFITNVVASYYSSEGADDLTTNGSLENLTDGSLRLSTGAYNIEEGESYYFFALIICKTGETVIAHPALNSDSSAFASNAKITVSETGNEISLLTQTVTASSGKYDYVIECYYQNEDKDGYTLADTITLSASEASDVDSRLKVIIQEALQKGYMPSTNQGSDEPVLIDGKYVVKVYFDIPSDEEIAKYTGKAVDSDYSGTFDLTIYENFTYEIVYSEESLLVSKGKWALDQMEDQNNSVKITENYYYDPEAKDLVEAENPVEFTISDVESSFTVKSAALGGLSILFVPEGSEEEEEEEIVINYTIEFYISDDADAELSEFTKYGESITGSYSASKPEDGKTQMDTAFQTVCDELYSKRYIKKKTVETNIDEHNLVHKHYFVKNPNIGFNVEFEEIDSDTVTESINLEYDEYTGSFIAASGFDSYEWYIEENGEYVNVTVAAANANTFTPVLDDLSSGTHYVVVVVTKNGESYSSSKPFDVTKE